MKNKKIRFISWILALAMVISIMPYPVREAVASTETVITVDGQGSDWSTIPVLAESKSAGFQTFSINNFKMHSDKDFLYLWVQGVKVDTTYQRLDIALDVEGVNSNNIYTPIKFKYLYDPTPTDSRPDFHIIVPGTSPSTTSKIYKPTGTGYLDFQELNKTNCSFAVNATDGFEVKVPLSTLGLTEGSKVRAIVVLTGDKASGAYASNGGHGPFDVIPRNEGDTSIIASAWSTTVDLKLGNYTSYYTIEETPIIEVPHTPYIPPDFIGDKNGLKSAFYNITGKDDETIYTNKKREQIFSTIFPDEIISVDGKNDFKVRTGWKSDQYNRYGTHLFFPEIINPGSSLECSAAKLWGYIKVPQSGDYYFGIQSDDGAYGYIITEGNTRVFADEFKSKVTSFHTTYRKVQLKKDQPYPIYIEYFNKGGNASFELFYKYNNPWKNEDWILSATSRKIDISKIQKVKEDWLFPTTINTPGEVATKTFDPEHRPFVKLEVYDENKSTGTFDETKAVLRDTYEAMNPYENPNLKSKTFESTPITLKDESGIHFDIKGSNIKEVKYAFIESTTPPTAVPSGTGWNGSLTVIKQEIPIEPEVATEFQGLTVRQYDVSGAGFETYTGVNWKDRNKVFNEGIAGPVRKIPTYLAETNMPSDGTKPANPEYIDNAFQLKTTFTKFQFMNKNAIFKNYKQATRFWGYIYIDPEKYPDASGDYYFGTFSDDGSYGYIMTGPDRDTKQVISDQFGTQYAKFHTLNQKIHLEVGVAYPIHLEYVNIGGDAEFRLLYRKDTPFPITQTAQVAQAHDGTQATKDKMNAAGVIWQYPAWKTEYDKIFADANNNDVPADWFRATNNHETIPIDDHITVSTVNEFVPFPEKPGTYYVAVKSENNTKADGSPGEIRESIYGPFIVPTFIENVGISNYFGGKSNAEVAVKSNLWTKLEFEVRKSIEQDNGTVVMEMDLGHNLDTLKYTKVAGKIVNLSDVTLPGLPKTIPASNIEIVGNKLRIKGKLEQGKYEINIFTNVGNFNPTGDVNEFYKNNVYNKAYSMQVNAINISTKKSSFSHPVKRKTGKEKLNVKILPAPKLI